MARPRIPIGSFGSPSYQRLPSGAVLALVRMRDVDGRTRKVEATGRSRG
jgi:hypothetical protein